MFAHFGLNLCEKFDGHEFGDSCLNYYEILCMADAEDCISDDMTPEEIRNCLYETFAPEGWEFYPPIDPDCGVLVEMFLITNGINMSDREFCYKIGGCDDICSDSSTFSENALKELTDYHIEQRGYALTQCEDSLRWEHKLCAYNIFANQGVATDRSERLIPNVPWSGGGCNNALKHALWIALNAKSCGEDLADLFADAHECEAAPNSEREMDYHNNDVGLRIQRENPNANRAELEDLICQAIQNGELLVLENPQDPNSPLIDSNNCPQCQ